MSLRKTVQQTSEQSKPLISRPTQIIKELLDYYKGREYALVRLCYKNGVTQLEIARALDVDRSLIARYYPMGVKGSK